MNSFNVIKTNCSNFIQTVQREWANSLHVTEGNSLNAIGVLIIRKNSTVKTAALAGCFFASLVFCPIITAGFTGAGYYFANRIVKFHDRFQKDFISDNLRHADHQDRKKYSKKNLNMLMKVSVLAASLAVFVMGRSVLSAGIGVLAGTKLSEYVASKGWSTMKNAINQDLAPLSKLFARNPVSETEKFVLNGKEINLTL